MGQLDRIDLTKLYPKFAGKLQQLVEACNARGALYVATSGLRDYAQQDRLYEIGRTTGTPGHIVTRARGGYSLHNFGVAADFSFATQLSPLKLDDRERNYKVLAEEAAHLGLVSGLTWDSSFKDPNHVQLPVKQMGFTLADLRAAYKRGGYPAVFALFDSWQTTNGDL